MIQRLWKRQWRYPSSFWKPHAPSRWTLIKVVVAPRSHEREERRPRPFHSFRQEKLYWLPTRRHLTDCELRSAISETLVIGFAGPYHRGLPYWTGSKRSQPTQVRVCREAF